MATKSELEGERVAYETCLHNANQALAANDYHLAIQKALEAMPYLESTMQYEKRYEKSEHASFAAHEIIFRHAPPMFHFKSLNQVDNQLEKSRKLKKHDTYDFGARLDQAREEMREAAKLWDIVGKSIAVGRNDHFTKHCLAVWERAGYIERVGGASTLTHQHCLQLHSPIRGKCPYCGAVSIGKKSSFLKDVRCLKCSAKCLFVLLGPPAPGK